VLGVDTLKTYEMVLYVVRLSLVSTNQVKNRTIFGCTFVGGEKEVANVSKLR